MSTDTQRPFAMVNVFSHEPLLGNPVAVVLDGDGLTEDEMQRLARWLNVSETTFLLPPTVAGADYRARIFTPGGELPFAGHPTLGSVHAWLEHGGTPRTPDTVVQECAAGLIPVRRADVLAFAAPPTLRSGPLDEAYVAQIATAFGIARDAILDHQWIDNGPGWGVVRLAHAEDVIALEPNLALIPDAMIGAVGPYPPGSAHQFELRTFAPKLGLPEDPVCGSMNASVAQWFARTGEVDADYRVAQGRRLHRAGTIDISYDADGTVWIGGPTTTYVRGTVAI